jgi:hypothetical protein
MARSINDRSSPEAVISLQTSHAPASAYTEAPKDRHKALQ